MKEFIPLSTPNFKGKELNYITEAIKSKWGVTAGNCVRQFEENLAAYVKAKFSSACQSGTAGLHLALLALGVSKNEEVIVPTLTFIATVNPVRYVGAYPVFMDCDDSLCIDTKKLAAFLKEECIFSGGILTNKLTGRRIKAILAVHIFGNLANMYSLMEIAKKYELYVIEDAAEALGTYYTSGPYKGQYAGTIGDIGVYSFNENKIVTTGGGGMVVSKNSKLISRIKHLEMVRYTSDEVKDDDLDFVHNSLSYSYRMTNVQAAIGLGQLEQIEDFIAAKKRSYNLYLEQGIDLLPFMSDIRPNYWFFSHITNRRDDLISHMAKNNIQTRPIWELIHTEPCYKNSQNYRIEKAFDYLKKVVNLPCGSGLEYRDVKVVCDAIKAFYQTN